jgi:hypothetical protein
VVNKLDNSNFVLIYSNQDKYYGISKIGNTNKFELPTIIDDLKELNISVYPNPASEILFVNLGKINQMTEIQIVNMTGQILHKEFTNKWSITLNIGDLNKGIYYINIITKKHKVTKKIIKT